MAKDTKQILDEARESVRQTAEKIADMRKTLDALNEQSLELANKLTAVCLYIQGIMDNNKE